MTRSTSAFLIVALPFIAAGCNRSESPSGLFVGTWTGTVADADRGSGSLRLVLEQRGSALTGTLKTTFQNVTDRDGPITGMASGSSSTVFFTPPQPLACGSGLQLPGTVTFTLQLAGGRLTGSYAGLTCGGAVGGTVDLRPE